MFLTHSEKATVFQLERVDLVLGSFQLPHRNVPSRQPSKVSRSGEVGCRLFYAPNLLLFMCKTAAILFRNTIVVVVVGDDDQRSVELRAAQQVFYS